MASGHGGAELRLAIEQDLRAKEAGAVGRPAETVALTLWSAAHGVAVLRVEDPHDQHGFDAKASAAVLSAVVASL